MKFARMMLEEMSKNPAKGETRRPLAALRGRVYRRASGHACTLREDGSGLIEVDRISASRFTGWELNKLQFGVLAVFGLLAACTANPPPKETTVDGRSACRPEPKAACIAISTRTSTVTSG